jgi:hypothetical protein
MVPLAVPPASTNSVPPLKTEVASAVPPDNISNTFPLVTGSPELSTPEETKVVVIALSP